MGTSEPRVVKLFPTESCSCPAKGSCYHVLAARMAVGLRQENPHRPLNLTQLRRNKRKKADKTCGRKRPRADDVDVVAAGDADPDVAATLAAVINAVPQKDDDDVEPDDQPPAVDVDADPDVAVTSAAIVNDAEVDDQDTCHHCQSTVPPPKKGRRVKGGQSRQKIDSWVECERCQRWFHCICVPGRSVCMRTLLTFITVMLRVETLCVYRCL